MHAANRRGLAYMTRTARFEGPAAQLRHDDEPDIAVARPACPHRLSQPGQRGGCTRKGPPPLRHPRARRQCRRQAHVRRQSAEAAARQGDGTEPDIIIIDEPTRGIDVGTKQQIYHFISALARDGRSIIVVSSEMPEVIGLCTRVAVMREGRIVGMLEGDEISEQEIMRYAAGLKKMAAA